MRRAVDLTEKYRRSCVTDVKNPRLQGRKLVSIPDGEEKEIVACGHAVDRLLQITEPFPNIGHFVRHKCNHTQATGNSKGGSSDIGIYRRELFQVNPVGNDTAFEPTEELAASDLSRH